MSSSMTRVVASGITRQMSRTRPATGAKRIAQRRHQRVARVHVGLLQSRGERAFRQRFGHGGFQSLGSFAEPAPLLPGRR